MPAESNPQTLVERIMEHLVELNEGECSITDETILAEPNKDVQQVLAGLRMLHEDRVFQEEERARHEERQREVQDKLQQTQKLEAIGKLAGGVAHDFNNLLTSILSFAGFVRDDLPPGDKRRDDIREVLAAADRAAGLTRQLLLFSRQQPMEPHRLDIGLTLKSTERLLRRTIGEDIQLNIQVPTEPVYVLADPTQLDQVLLNLAVNARDAMPKGGTLCISATTVVPARGQRLSAPPLRAFARIEVADSGTGMDEETLRHIFEPFYTTKGPDEGTGLGLATCYGAVNQMGGTIDVSSTLGKGTTIVIDIPLHQGPTDKQAPVATPRGDLRGNECILFIEDESSVRCVCARTLTRHGYDVIVADDGRDGMELFERNRERIDLVFSDIVLPHGNGFDIATELRRQHPNLRILLTSGYTDNRAVKENSEFSIFWKPYTPAELTRRIRACLDEPP